MNPYKLRPIAEAVRAWRNFPSPADTVFTATTLLAGLMLPYHEHFPHVHQEAPETPNTGRPTVITSTSTAGAMVSIAPIWPNHRGGS